MFNFKIISVNFIKIVILIFIVLNVPMAGADASYIISGVVHMNESEGVVMPVDANLFVTSNIKLNPNLFYGVNPLAYPPFSTNGSKYKGVYAHTEKNIPGLYVTFGYRYSGGDVFIKNGNTYLMLPDGVDNTNLIISFFTENGVTIPPGEYLIVGSGVMMLAEFTDAAATNIANMYMMDLNLQLIVTATSCSVTTPKNVSINWPSVSVTDIKNGSATEKTAPVTVNCQGTGTTSPMDVFLSSNNGSADAQGGVINTSSNNLGLKLTWADGGAAIPLDSTFQLPAPAAGSTKNLAIVAKPVATGTGQIAGGDFNTTLTMTIQYH